MFQHMWYTFGWNVCSLSSLMGKWVRKLGFKVGDLIRLKVERNRIIIKNMEMKEVTEQEGYAFSNLN